MSLSVRVLLPVPGEPVMPGVLIMEGLAQAGAILAYITDQDKVGENLVYFGGMDKVRFRKIVVPGDQLIFDIKVLKRKGKVFRLTAHAYVDDELAAEAVLLATFSFIFFLISRKTSSRLSLVKLG